MCLLDIDSLIFMGLMMKLVLLVSLMATFFFTDKVEGGTIREKREICDRDIDDFAACIDRFVSYERIIIDVTFLTPELLKNGTMSSTLLVENLSLITSCKNPAPLCLHLQR